RSRRNRIDREIFQFNVVDRPQLDTALPVQRHLQPAHNIARQVFLCGGAFQLNGAWMIVNAEREQQTVGEGRQGIRPAPKRGAVRSIHALEIVEETWRRDAAGKPKTWPVGNRSIGHHYDAAVVVPHRLSRGGVADASEWQANSTTKEVAKNLWSRKSEA